MLTDLKNWSGIEHQELDSRNWVQVAFRATRSEEGAVEREYKVFGEIRGEEFSEDFYFDDSKRLAYEFFYEKCSILDNGCIYCVECGEYATNAEFASAVSQTGGYCLGCAPDPDDETAIRWL